MTDCREQAVSHAAGLPSLMHRRSWDVSLVQRFHPALSHRRDPTDTKSQLKNKILGKCTAASL